MFVCWGIFHFNLLKWIIFIGITKEFDLKYGRCRQKIGIAIQSDFNFKNHSVYTLEEFKRTLTIVQVADKSIELNGCAEGIWGTYIDQKLSRK